MRKRARARHKPKKKPRLRTKNTRPLGFASRRTRFERDSSQAVDRRDPARARKGKISLSRASIVFLFPRERSISSSQKFLHISGEKIKNKSPKPYLFTREFATVFLSEETDRADWVVAENILCACLWRSRFVVFYVCFRAPLFLVVKKIPFQEKGQTGFFASFFFQREREIPGKRGDWRSFFFLP